MIFLLVRISYDVLFEFVFKVDKHWYIDCFKQNAI